MDDSLWDRNDTEWPRPSFTDKVEPCIECGEDVPPEEPQWILNARAHRECMMRMVMGGIGHFEDHNYWCKQMGDPDGGRTRRQSALEVAALALELGGEEMARRGHFHD